MKKKRLGAKTKDERELVNDEKEVYHSWIRIRRGRKVERTLRKR